ncbi:hypothetical protein BGW36DRAFT_202126 [Talaromyces proteolyticus]|uniref:Uncharacterized protein n=1 Tax=Talaromyces proteolyticus TaxID=1131652 RepID=A0AAD4KRJ8_9EURO|nr:uncharacterized protein BGW36DRAFT_202126 [Talaromyces proteolyticus]KAH8695436.1 hypothetical protein BGW36DRAFT_202126 [Talaromyces proteolyticus]
MPRTRSQASVSPLVSLDAPRRRRKATASSLDADDQEEPKTKMNRVRKTKKATVSRGELLEEEALQKNSENPYPITPVHQEPKDSKEVPKDKESTISTNTMNKVVDDSPSLSDCGVTPCSPPAMKRGSFKRALINVKAVLKKPTESIRLRFKNLKKARTLKEDSRNKTITIADATGSQYSFTEDEILESAMNILLSRMDSDYFDNASSAPALRCPCCQGSLECPEGHDLASWVPNDLKESMNALLTNFFAEGICNSSEEEEEAREADERRQFEHQRQVEEKRMAEENLQSEIRKDKEKGQAKPKAKDAESLSKQKGKKRSRETNDHENHDDDQPISQRPRLTPANTPYKRRATTTPRRKLTYAEIRQRTRDREEGNGPPSMFRLDQAIAHHEAQEKAEVAARQAAEEAAEAERIQKFSRAEMERHTVAGPIPENARNPLQIPIFRDETQDSETPDMPDTPGSSSWGFQVRNILSSVSGSVRRFVPRFRNVTDQAVPFGKESRNPSFASKTLLTMIT